MVGRGAGKPHGKRHMATYRFKGPTVQDQTALPSDPIGKTKLYFWQRNFTTGRKGSCRIKKNRTPCCHTTQPAAPRARHLMYCLTCRVSPPRLLRAKAHPPAKGFARQSPKKINGFLSLGQPRRGLEMGRSAARKHLHPWRDKRDTAPTRYAVEGGLSDPEEGAKKWL